MRRILFFLVCLALLACMICSVGSSVEAVERIVFNIPGSDPLASFQGQAIENFADLVDQKTEGRVKIVHYPSGQLGTQAEVFEALRVGGIKMMFADPAMLAQMLPEVGVFNFPYLFRDDKHALQAVDPDTSEVMKEIADELIREAGIRILGCGFWRGFRQLTTNFPVYKPEDLKGKKIRAIANKVWITMIEGMGAIATPIDFIETATSLMTGVVDGQENPLSTIYDNKFYPPVQKYLMLTNHLGAVMVLAIREDAWEELAPEDQVAIKEAMNETAEWSVEEVAKQSDELLRKLEDTGMIIISEDDGLDVEAFRLKVLDHAREIFPEWADYINRI